MAAQTPSEPRGPTDENPFSSNDLFSAFTQPSSEISVTQYQPGGSEQIEDLNQAIILINQLKAENILSSSALLFLPRFISMQLGPP